MGSVAYAQTGETPAAEPGATPTSARDQELQERQIDKLTYEIRVLQQREQTLAQARTLEQWRAIAQTLTEFGFLALGFGLLIILARALERWHIRSTASLRSANEDPPDPEAVA
jgi:hypothetical protein